MVDALWLAERVAVLCWVLLFWIVYLNLAVKYHIIKYRVKLWIATQVVWGLNLFGMALCSTIVILVTFERLFNSI